LEWFGQDSVRADSARLRFVERFKRADEQHHGDAGQTPVALDALAQFVARETGHDNIRQHNVRHQPRFESPGGFRAVADDDDLQPLVREGQADNFLRGG
jgi:hypothetical protein